MDEHQLIHPIGHIHSSIKSREQAPLQGSEGAPDAWLEINPAFRPALDGIVAGSEIIIVTWLHLSRRDELTTHPRGDRRAARTGVFATRSPNRPNPLGLHRVVVKEVLGERLLVGPLEAIDRTPIVDIKPVLTQSDDS